MTDPSENTSNRCRHLERSLWYHFYSTSRGVLNLDSSWAIFRWKRAKQPRCAIVNLDLVATILIFLFHRIPAVIMQPKQQAKKETGKPATLPQGDKAKANMAKPDVKADPK